MIAVKIDGPISSIERADSKISKEALSQFASLLGKAEASGPRAWMSGSRVARCAVWSGRVVCDFLRSPGMSYVSPALGALGIARRARRAMRMAIFLAAARMECAESHGFSRKAEGVTPINPSDFRFRSSI